MSNEPLLTAAFVSVVLYVIATVVVRSSARLSASAGSKVKSPVFVDGVARDAACCVSEDNRVTVVDFNRRAYRVNCVTCYVLLRVEVRDRRVINTSHSDIEGSCARRAFEVGYRALTVKTSGH